MVPVQPGMWPPQAVIELVVTPHDKNQDTVPAATAAWFFDARGAPDILVANNAIACCRNDHISLPMSGSEWFHALLKLGVREAVGLRSVHPSNCHRDIRSCCPDCLLTVPPCTHAASSSLAWRLVL